MWPGLTRAGWRRHGGRRRCRWTRRSTPASLYGATSAAAGLLFMEGSALLLEVGGLGGDLESHEPVGCDDPEGATISRGLDAWNLIRHRSWLLNLLTRTVLNHGSKT